MAGQIVDLLGPAMGAGEGLEGLRWLVMADAALQGQLWAETEREAFVALAVALGESRGCRFAAEDVRQALLEGRRTWIERWLP